MYPQGFMLPLAAHIIPQMVPASGVYYPFPVGYPQMSLQQRPISYIPYVIPMASHQHAAFFDFEAKLSSNDGCVNNTQSKTKRKDEQPESSSPTIDLSQAGSP